MQRSDDLAGSSLFIQLLSSFVRAGGILCYGVKVAIVLLRPPHILLNQISTFQLSITQCLLQVVSGGGQSVEQWWSSASATSATWDLSRTPSSSHDGASSVFQESGLRCEKNGQQQTFGSS